MEDPSRTRASGERDRSFLLTVLLSIVLAGAQILGHEPPPPKTADAPPSRFSASRASRVLSILLSDGAPHPVGSEAGARVRERIRTELVRLGYEPSVEAAFACGHAGSCATAQNVVARLPGRNNGKAVLLCAHYDSVGAGPGASDDGMGVAALLEIARILKSEPSRRNPVLFLFDEGEEAGLIGAEVFVKLHPVAATIGAVVNLENRGTSGTSYLFETSAENRWLVDIAARALERPATSSLFYSIYKLLPNDTDLTVFRAHALSGVNFAAIGGAARYHTSRDDVEHASLATLQHHGDNALAMARALAEADLSQEHAGDAVFFDLFGIGIVRWEEGVTLPLAVAAFVLLAAGLVFWSRSNLLTPASLLLGLACAIAMPLLAGVAGLGVAFLLRLLGALPAPWIANPFWMLAAVWSVALSAAWFLASGFARRAGSGGLWGGVWLLWSTVALVLAWRLPLVSFLFLVPAAAAAALSIPGLLAKPSLLRQMAIAAPAGAAAFFWLPVAWFLVTALGSRFGLGFTAAAVGIWAATAAPAFTSALSLTRRRALYALGAAALATLVVAVWTRPFTPESPQRMSLEWSKDAASQRSRWLLYPESLRLPGEFARAARFSPTAISPYPWSGSSRAFAAEAPDPGAAPPTIVLSEDSRQGSFRRIRLRIRSERGAPTVFLAISPSVPVVSMKVAGELVPPINPRVLSWREGWRVLKCLTTPPEGAEFEIEAGSDPHLELYAGDRSPGLASGGELLLRARGPEAVASQDGDGTVVTRRLKL